MAVTFVKIAWTNSIITRLSRTVTYTAATKTTDNITGDETFTLGTPTSYSMAALKMRDAWYFDKEGLVEGGDAYAMIKAATLTPTKNSTIAFDGDTYRIQDVRTVYGDNNNNTTLFHKCNLFKTA